MFTAVEKEVYPIPVVIVDFYSTLNNVDARLEGFMAKKPSNSTIDEKSNQDLDESSEDPDTDEFDDDEDEDSEYDESDMEDEEDE